MPSHIALERSARWVVARLPGPHRVLSWAVLRGGMCLADVVAWHQVDNAELPVGVDPAALLQERLDAAQIPRAVAMLTSRDLRFVHSAQAEQDGVRATAVVTAGFSNALAVGDPPGPHTRKLGTINVLGVVSRPLSLKASLEAMSIVAEARTSAVLEVGVPSVASERFATGTGTDCIVLAAPEGVSLPEEAYAGKHTPLGSALGEAVRSATLEAAHTWLGGAAQREREHLA